MLRDIALVVVIVVTVGDLVSAPDRVETSPRMVSNRPNKAVTSLVGIALGTR